MASSLAFINVGEPSAQRRRRNANQARSLVMTERWRRQRLAKKDESHSQSMTSDEQVDGKDHELEMLCTQSQHRSPRFLFKPMDPEFASAVWATTLQKSLRLKSLSNASFVERDIVALRAYGRPVTMHLHKLINHVVRTMWPKYWPARNTDEASPLAIAWWPLFMNIPVVFHVFMYAAAVHHDDLMGKTELSQSREILSHKNEALLEMQKSLGGNDNPMTMDDALLLAMTYLGMESEDNPRSGAFIDSGPFNPPNILCSIQWTRHYAYAKENAHIQAATRLVNMKGGLPYVIEPLAKSMAINDLQIAAKYVRKPIFPFWDIPEIITRIEDPGVNVLPGGKFGPSCSCDFKNLVCLGLSEEAFALIQRTKIISMKLDLYSKGELLTPDFHLLLCEKNNVHHGLLSLPSGADLGLRGQECDIYDCCRIGGLLYSLGVLFPLPPSTGAPLRLLKMTKQIVQDVRLETCLHGGSRVVIWVLVLAGIMAQNTLERPWFLRRMRPILAMEGIKTWSELKNVLNMFLWMDSACDEPARCLFEELSHPPYL